MLEFQTELFERNVFIDPESIVCLRRLTKIEKLFSSYGSPGLIAADLKNGRTIIIRGTMSHIASDINEALDSIRKVDIHG